jgi:hypothetical protein
MCLLCHQAHPQQDAGILIFFLILNIVSFSSTKCPCSHALGKQVHHTILWELLV